MKLFLVVYDRSLGRLLSLDEYDEEGRADALRRRAQLEMERREQAEVEVVVLAAESLAALKKTHSRYFETLTEKMSSPASVG
jgi:hypothetical protein